MRRVILALATLLAACSPGTVVTQTTLGSATPPSTTQPPAAATVPSSADFYTPPDPLPDGAPGDVIWVDPIHAPDGVSAWKVLYLSRDLAGDPIAVSGWVAIPDEGDAIPVVAFGHGTTGLGDKCAPTVRGGQAPHNFAGALDSGYAVAYTDYAGLGTPGLHPYLVGSVAAQSVIDVARAARAIDHRVTDQVAFWGFSQGGHAVLFAAQLAPEVAPELDVVGTVAVAPAIDISGWIAENPPGQRDYLAMVAVAYVDALGLDPAAWLGDALLGRRQGIAEGCLLDATTTVAGIDEIYRLDPLATEPLASFIHANDPGIVHITSPVLLANGSEDWLLTPALADDFAETMCGADTVVDRIVVPDANHLQTFGDSVDAVMEWIGARFANEPVTDVCAG